MTLSKNAPNFVAVPVKRATAPSSMSMAPAMKMMVPAMPNWPLER